MPSSRIKDEDKYKALLDKGYSKQKSARMPIHPIPEVKAEKQKNMRNGQRKNYINRLKMWVLKADQR